MRPYVRDHLGRCGVNCFLPTRNELWPLRSAEISSTAMSVKHRVILLGFEESRRRGPGYHCYVVGHWGVAAVDQGCVAGRHMRKHTNVLADLEPRNLLDHIQVFDHQPCICS
jgi:hypothetical protein